MRTVSLRRLGLIIMAIFSFNCYSQARDYDSISIYIQRYEYQKAIDKIDAIDKYNSDLSLLDLKATALKGLNKYQEAIKAYEKLLMNDTGDLKNIIEIANCYQSLGDYKKAHTYYKKAIKISPYNNYLYQQLAKCFDNLGKTDTAIFFYQEAFNLNPMDFESAYRLANLYKQNEDYKTAINITDTFLINNSTNLRMLKLNGYLNFLNKDYIKAITSFEKCVSQEDTSDFTNKYLGYSYFRAGEYMKAKDYLEKAFQKDTSNVELCYILGLSCDYSVYKKLGIQYLSKTIELATPSAAFLSQVYQDLAAANTGFYKYEEALEAYMKAYELTPNDTLLIFKIASHYDNWIKDKEKALKYYQAFMETRPKERAEPPEIPMPGGIVVSYYDYVERRMGEIKEELFWKGEKHDTPLTK
jgi:tetratricopeptide (TPR) repeat protein